MNQTVDARGLSCPQPVLMAVQTMRKAGSGAFEVLVDNEASRENVARAAQSQGWDVTVHEMENGEFKLALVKQ
ncbi:TusA-related sulfurtransferase [Desulfomicrobium macestii]|uniref:TusA-related sulfurtransferase n=2 Tax=Desulfomicrobium TaxID=898 RepID=A0A8G2C0Q8_DESNO|nr:MULTISPECIES: sulfurtransferase TusA family protein [Desulfomicrobium]MBE1424066.1 TusA-related sulfurtransferase [Desulfomicrobium macestii]SFL40815.1 TusA-related sulfurtransferase [Desulfomicrobium norvegicum]